MSRNNTKINNISDNILLLDNEYDVVAMFMLTLERHGFQSVGFTEPLLALEHFQKNSEKYALVISDVRMPVINGYQFIKEVKEIKREVKVFFMSAFDIDYVTPIAVPSSFHTIIVRLKQYAHLGNYTTQSTFHTIIVRLKHGTNCPLGNNCSPFPHYYSTIETSHAGLRARLVSFHTIIVRLKLT